MLEGNVVDQLHDDNGFTDTGTPEESDFTPFGVRREEVNDFDPGLEDFGFGALLFEGRRIAVNRPVLFGLKLTGIINGFSDDIENPSEDFFADGDFDRTAGCFDFLTPY